MRAKTTINRPECVYFYGQETEVTELRKSNKNTSFNVQDYFKIHLLHFEINKVSFICKKEKLDIDDLPQNVPTISSTTQVYILTNHDNEDQEKKQERASN